jgi:hypothetical protein
MGLPRGLSYCRVVAKQDWRDVQVGLVDQALFEELPADGW